MVVFSHLRWDWVWQRPQHLISRIGASTEVVFVEEPLATGAEEPHLVTARDGNLTRVWLEVPGSEHPSGFEPWCQEIYRRELPAILGERSDRLVWMYTPLALPLVEEVDHTALVYDVMDDLASFDLAAHELVLRQGQLLRRADVVFTGGRSLQRGVAARRPEGTHCFPSGVDARHFEGARGRRGERERPVAGYVGVVDERLDVDLIAGLAAELTDWDVRIVGPVAKIDAASLPQAPNLTWAGPRTYDELPGELAGFDVALMPFALNEATRSISPTKTLEYLAAGLPVVSTRVPDVVAEHDTVVDLRDDAAGFAAACREVLDHDLSARDRKLQPLLSARSWDRIAVAMLDHIGEVARARRAELEEGEVSA
ncbi:MAG TPA: glycosyltransferase [Aquihabitans sp.]|jgi:glycosyltransferase involved in cell wall biosynthesis|nr:glycosyltransferase [Aquihabitans sp.]